MDYTTYGQPWQKKKIETHRLPVKANHIFFLKHHPQNWELVYIDIKKGKETIKKPYWLPALHTHKLTPGVNGCQMNGKQIDSSLAKSRVLDEGYTIIDPEKYDYIRVYPCNRGNYHVDKFTKIERIGNRIVTTYNLNDYNLFRKDLVKAGAIKLPHPVILKGIIVDTKKRLHRKGNKSHIPEQRRIMDELVLQIEDMEKCIDTIEKTGIKYYA